VDEPVHLPDGLQTGLHRLAHRLGDRTERALVDGRQQQSHRRERPVEVVHGLLRRLDQFLHLVLQQQALLVEFAEAPHQLEVGLDRLVEQLRIDVRQGDRAA
jgi:hypothetical protein